ncbi:MAG: Ig-like domain-containing protein [Verrucomicrobiota bacterium]
MLINKILRNTAFGAALFCLAMPRLMLAQGGPDIIWERKVNIDRVNSVVFTPDGNTLISGGSDRLINFWRVSDGALLQTLNTNAPFVHESAVESLSITPDGSLLASASFQVVQLWDLPSGTVRRLTGHTDWVVGVAFSPDGSLLASASFDTTVRIWRASDGVLVNVIQGVGQQRCVAFSPDGSLVATAGGDNTVKFWRTSDWTLVRTMTGHTDDIFAIAFSPDGNTIASGGYDDTVKLWDVATGALRFTFSGNGGNVYSVAFTPDGSKVVYTDGEGSTVKVYRVVDGQLLRTFNQDVNEVQTLAFSPTGLMGYGRVDTTVLLARIDGTVTPRARISSPAPGATFNAPGSITIAASPSKTDGSIVNMEFFQNGTKLGEDSVPPYTLAWTNIAAGTYTLTVVDTDDLGGITTSTPVTITVVNITNAPPAITITGPGNGAFFNAPANITIKANASAAAGVSRVEFFQNGITLGQDVVSPFSMVWSSVAIGNYSLTATITDANGAQATSAPINISVQEAPPETVKPRVTIASPASGARLTSSNITLSGTASDNVGVAQVLYSLNSAGFVAAIGTANWEADLTLIPGSNVVQVISVDASGNESAVVSRLFTYVVSAPLELSVNGFGTVTPFTDGKILEVGKSYTIKAVAGRDYIFNGWSGSVITNTPVFSFIMTQGMSLIATFIPNPFAQTKGIYIGLIQPTTPNHEHSGFIRLNSTSSGTFSGKVTLGASSYSLRGKFNGDGSFTGKHSRSELVLNLQLHLDDNSDQITGSISDGSFTSTLAADRLVFNAATNPAPRVGKYTILIPSNPSRPNSPQGNGFGILKVDASGKTRMAGSLADGTKFSQSAGVSKNATWPFHVSLYAAKGSILGEVKFRNQVGVSDLNGTVNWFRPANSASKFFANGFTTQTSLLGSGYSQATGQPVLTVPAGEENVLVNLGEGDLQSDLQQPATLEINNQFVIPASSNEEKLRVSISATSGALRGSFVHPVTGRTTKHNGVVFQKQNRAEGYFLGTGQSGFVSVVPKDEASTPLLEEDPAPIVEEVVPVQPVPQPRRKKGN